MLINTVICNVHTWTKRQEFHKDWWDDMFINQVLQSQHRTRRTRDKWVTILILMDWVSRITLRARNCVSAIAYRTRASWGPQDQTYRGILWKTECEIRERLVKEKAEQTPQWVYKVILVTYITIRYRPKEEKTTTFRMQSISATKQPEAHNQNFTKSS